MTWLQIIYYLVALTGPVGNDSLVCDINV